LWYADGHFPDSTYVSLTTRCIVWLIPFALFVSLTAGENVLPSTSELQGAVAGDRPQTGKSKRGGPGMAKMVVDSVKDWFSGVGETFGWTGEASRRRFD